MLLKSQYWERLRNNNIVLNLTIERNQFCETYLKLYRTSGDWQVKSSNSNHTKPPDQSTAPTEYRNLMRNLQVPLCHPSKCCFPSLLFRSRWKAASVTPGHGKASKYRPISMLSDLGKVTHQARSPVGCPPKHPGQRRSNQLDRPDGSGKLLPRHLTCSEPHWHLFWWVLSPFCFSYVLLSQAGRGCSVPSSHLQLIT